MKPDMQPPAIVREAADLSELAARINREHQAGTAATRKGLENFREAGEALIKAKGLCGHGEWLKWLEKNVHFDRRTATNYMKIAREWETVSHLESMRDVLRVLTSDTEDEPDSLQPAIGVPKKLSVYKPTVTMLKPSAPALPMQISVSVKDTPKTSGSPGPIITGDSPELNTAKLAFLVLLNLDRQRFRDWLENDCRPLP